MKNILLIRRIQKDEQWEKDCYNIAANIFADLNYKFPYGEYTELLIEALGKFIAEGEVYLSQPLDIHGLFDEVFKQGFYYAIKHDKNSEYFEFDLTDEDIKKINELTKKHIKIFYNKDNSLIKKLSLLPSNVVIIYPVKFYAKILEEFYKHNNPYFKASYNNDDECIKEYCKVNHINKYKVIKL